MNAGIRSKARRTWPRGLREPRQGYFTWCPPTDVLPYLDHPAHAGRARPGAKVRDMTLGQAFAEARDAAGVAVAGKTPPTFHEIRSLSLRLYHDQGINAQALAGHKSADMTAIYRDVRGDEWVKVS